MKTVFNEPYPNMGSVLNALADIADTKGLAVKGDSRYRKEEDWSSRKTVAPEVLDEAIKNLFYHPITDHIDEEFAAFFSKTIEYGLTYYVELMKRFPLEGVDQAKVIHLLNRHVFVEMLAGVIVEIGLAQMGDTVPTFFVEDNPIQVLVNYIESQNEKSDESIKKVFEDNIRTANKWLSGEEIPNLGNTVLLAHWASKSYPDDEKRDKINMFLARFIAAFHKKTNYKFTPALKEAVIQRLELGTAPALDFGKIFGEFYANELNALDLGPLAVNGRKLHQLLTRSSEKPEGSFLTYSLQLAALEVEIADNFKTEELQYHLEWLWGRMYILSGQLEKAQEQYAKAVESALYKAGSNLKDIIREALAVAAIQRKRDTPLFKRLKSRALTFYPNMVAINNPDKPQFVSNDDIQEWQLWFVARFPKSGWFDEGKESLEQRLKELKLDELANKFSRQELTH